MSLDDLEKEIYSFRARDRAPRKKAPAPAAPKTAIPEQWTETEEEESRLEERGMPRPLKYALWTAGIVSPLVAIGAFLFIFNYNPEAQNVEVEIIGPKEVYRGAPFEISVSVTNQTNNLLRQAKLGLDLPPGLALLGENERGVTDEDIGDIGDGSFQKKTYRLLPTGESNSVSLLTARISYAIASRARFEKDGEKEILIKEPAVRLAVAEVGNVLSGTNFKIKIDYENISDYDFDETSLTVDYPSGFRFLSADFNPSSLNNYWRLGEIASRSKGSLEIEGVIDTAEQNQFNFPISLKASFLGKDHVVADYSLAVALAPSPISVQILINNQSGYTARVGDNLGYTIRYQNKSGIALNDVVVKAEFAGELFDFATIRSSAGLDTVRNALTWNPGNTPALATLDPTSIGEVNFTVNLKPSFPITRLSDKNFHLKVNVSIDSPSVPFYLQAQKTSGWASLETKVAGFMTIGAEGYYRDIQAQIANTGPLPPQANKPTTYTIHWLIKNYAVDARNVEARTFLKSGVRFTGQAKSNTDTVPLYNEQTQEMVWNIEKIVANKGVVNNLLEAVFQVEATPNTNEIGLYKGLIGETILRGTDDFTGADMFASAPELTTALSSDKTLSPSDGRVAP